MSIQRRFFSYGLSFVLYVTVSTTAAVFAEDRSFYSPVIYIDKEQNQILISTSGKVFYIEVPEAARPHMEKLPLSGLVDFVVEMRGEDQRPLIKTWKVKSGESTCMYFNGTECKSQ
ncbi:MAG: hypothetical protein CV081_04130 [Nitrospira sp. LK265]|nr:hypothetical protein [Nitrospira sp.]NGZ59677.1 hypothetical protein [Nitrospira sp. LK265]